MYGDPSGLLERIPELKPLCEDGRIRKAVGSGDPFRVYRALALAWLFRRLPGHRETLTLLLNRRRLFARPLDGSPTLFTFNSVGMGFVGEDEHEADGTHVTTHCVVALFLVPLFPLGAYLVQSVPAEGAFGRGSWRIFARVPLGLWTWLWTRGLALAAMLAVVAAGAQAFLATRYHEVTVLNGFQRPLAVSAGTSRELVPAGGRISLRVPVGTQALRATGEDGTELEAFQAEVRSGSQELVWNVAGAAPLYQAEVVYSSRKGEQPEPRPTLHCGQRWVEQREIDYAFREPPRELPVPKGTGRMVKHRLDVAPVPATVQLETCANVLLDEGQPVQAMALLEAAAALEHWQGEAGGTAASMAVLLAPERALEVTTRRREAVPGDLEAHRSYQQAAELAGRLEELRDEYRGRAQADPGSAEAQYLLARLLEGRELEAQTERALARFPQEPHLLGLAIGRRVARGDWAGTLAVWRAIAPQRSRNRSFALKAAAVALVATGQTGEAAALVEAQLGTLEGGDPLWAATLFARLEGLLGKPDGDRLLAQVEQGKQNRIVRLGAGLPVVGPPAGPLEAFAVALPRDPAGALARAAELQVRDLVFMSALEDAWLLAYAEAVRVGDERARASLARYPSPGPRARVSLDRYVKGESGDLDELDLGERAVARFIRSRNLALPERERQALVAAARRDDWLHTAVTEAIDTWPPPASGP